MILKYFIILIFAFTGLLPNIIPAQSLSGISKKEKKTTRFVELEYGYVRHLGEFEKVWSRSEGVLLTYGYNFNDQWVLNFKSGFYGTKVRNNVSFPENKGLGIVPLLIGGKYLFNIGNFQPYISFNNGFNLIFEKYDIEKNKTDKTLFKYFFQIGTGAYVKLVKDLKLNLGIKYNAHFYHIDAQMTGFEYSGGISYTLH